MKKKFLTIISLVLIGVLVYQNGGLNLLNSNTAYAVGDLDVVWNNDPLFNHSNITPGFESSNSVVVTNNAPSNRSVAIKGIKTSDTANMANVMQIEIKEGSNVLYFDTLANFFSNSSSPFGIYLSDLGNGSNTSYSIKITFDQNAGNEYQNKSIVFDLQMGITVGIPEACRSINFPNNPIVGTAENDKINGTTKNDLIITYEGNDKVSASGGDDCIITGEGNDQVDGGTGNDVIDLGDGDDKNTSSSGSDIVIGGIGNDVIDAGSGNDFIYGGIGNDKLEGGSGQDEIYGEDGNDNISGGSENDQILGGNGDDTMKGGSGNDNINGESDNDKATGDSGTDTCVAEIRNTCEL